MCAGHPYTSPPPSLPPVEDEQEELDDGHDLATAPGADSHAPCAQLNPVLACRPGSRLESAPRAEAFQSCKLRFCRLLRLGTAFIGHASLAGLE